MATLEERLAAVQAAILTIDEGGQEVQKGDRRVVMATRSQLVEDEKRLQTAIQTQKRGRSKIYYVVPQ